MPSLSFQSQPPSRSSFFLSRRKPILSLFVVFFFGFLVLFFFSEQSLPSSSSSFKTSVFSLFSSASSPAKEVLKVSDLKVSSYNIWHNSWHWPIRFRAIIELKGVTGCDLFSRSSDWENF
eukprot:TRINITY_DN8068_c0_g1_i1.p1 TRINITY_DN8068_c0_g1~~TRINITY_DN8068_c0_g1_i1.p1  ORF type:complete len:120 (-),score=24.68 TRINITY_DN8068_c0_g1_i1:162-521(-)